MVCSAFGRRLAVFVLFVLGVFTFGVGTASATHYQYGNVYWERDVTHPVSGEAKYRVTFEGGWRWSYPWPTGTGNCTGGIAPSQGTGSCPAVGAVVNLGTITSNKAVRFNGSATTATSISYNGLVNSVSAAQDLMFTTFTFEVIFPAATNPVTLVFTGNARLSSLLDGNNDSFWRIAVTLDSSNGTTRSPKSVSVPRITVTSGLTNQVVIPTMAYDNLSNRIRLATSAESSLVSPAPLAPSVFSITPGTYFINFTPRSTGLYAVQFIIGSYDINGVLKNEVPVDLMFQAVGVSPTLPIASVTTPSTNLTFPVGAASSFTVTSNLSSPDANWVPTITHTPLPPDAAFTQPAGSGTAAHTGTFSWTPTVSSSASIVCFQATYRNVTTQALLTSPGQVCVNIALAELATNLSTPTATNTQVGGSTTAVATLRRTIDNAVLALREVTFTAVAPDGTTTATTARTDVSGVATASVPVFRAGTHTLTATFAGVTGELLSSTSGPGTFGVTPAQGVLSAITPSGTPLVGSALSLSTTLTAISGPAAPAGTTVVFTITAPGGGTVSATTDAGGTATASFTPTVRGTYSVIASYDGATGGLLPTTSPVLSLPVKERTQISSASVTGVATDPTSVSASLFTFPAGTPIAGAVLTFNFNGVVPATDAVTDVNGIATTSVTFPAPGSYPATVSYTPSGDLVNSSGVSAPETDGLTANIGSIATALSTLTAPATVNVGGTVTASTTLTRLTAPAGALNGASVTFSLTAPGGAVSSQTVTTNAAGVATVTFPANVKGVHTLSASYLGTNALQATISNTATVTVYQRTSLSTNPVTAVAGDDTPVSATLLALPANTPISGQVVVFDIGGMNYSAVTSATGVATVNVAFPSAGTVAVTTSFLNAAAFFADANGALVPTTASTTANITVAATSLSVTASATAFVGDVLAIPATLLRVVPPAGAVNGATVAFTFTSGAQVTSLSAVTNAAGTAQVSHTATVRGPMATLAQFAGGIALASAQATASSVISQRTQLAVPPATGGAGTSVPVSATLTAIPGNAPIAGQTVTFSFPSLSQTLTAITDANGVATVSITSATAATVTVNATFSNAADYFVNASASGSVSVTDTTAPAIVATVNGQAGSNGWYVGNVNVSWTVTDAESAIATKTGCDAVTVSTDGTATITCTATSGGGTASETVTVKIDATAPVLTLAPAAQIEATSAAGALAAYAAATATDATSGAGQTSCSPIAGTQLPLGANTIACSVQDAAGNQASGNFVLMVTDTTAPVIDAAAGISTAATSPQGAVVTYAAPAWHDIVDGAGTTVCTPASGSTFPLGATPVTCTATDARGNSVSSSFTVTVTNTPPTVTVPGPISVPATSAAGAVVAFTATGNDAEQGAIAPVCVPASGSVFALGATTVNCSVADVAGATASASFSVTVTNNVPTISVPASFSRSATSAGGAVVTFTATGSDLEDGPLPATCAPASGSTFPLGATTVNCSVTDVAGASVSSAFTVTVTNNTPVVTVPTPITVQALNPAGMTVAFTATATDVEDGTLAVTCAPASGSLFPIGTTTVSCSATDVASATASANFQVTVQKVVPTMTWPTPAPITVGTALSGTQLNATANTAGTFVYTPAAGTQLPLGTQTLLVAFTPTDSTRYTTASASTTITIVARPPVAVADAATTLEGIAVTIPVLANDSDPASSPLTLISATVPSNGTAAVSGSNVVFTPPTSYAGLSTFSYTVRNGYGITATATVTVTVSRLGRFVVLSKESTLLRAGSTVVTGDVGAAEDRQRQHSHRDRNHDDDDSDDRDHRRGRGDRDATTVRFDKLVSMQQAGARVVGDAVELNKGAIVQNVITNDLDNNRATLLGTVTNSMVIPYVSLPAVPAMTVGTQNVTVAKRATMTLAAGRYRQVRVSEGATLILTGGLYELRSLDVDKSATVLFRAASEIRIQTELDVDGKSKLILDTTVSGLKASNIVFHVLGLDNDCGHRWHDDDDDDGGPVAVHIGAGSVVQANISAPRATVWLMSNIQATGAFFGEHVRIGRNTTLRLESAFK